MKIYFIFFMLVLCCDYFYCAKILGVFPFPGYSQFMLGEKLMEGLAKKGHEVTVISEYEPNEKIKNYETIKLEKSGDYDDSFDLFTWNNFNFYTLLNVFLEIGNECSEALLKQNVIQEFLHSNRTFDVVIVENFANEAHSGFAEHFKAPLVIFSSQPLNDWNSYYVGNVKLPSINPISLTHYTSHMTFFERLQNFALSIYNDIHREFNGLPYQQTLMDKYFPNKMDIKKVIANTEMILLFAHPLTTEPSLITSAAVEVGGLHIVSKKLPADIQNFLDGAKDGAIFISLGSNIPCSKFSKTQLEMFLNVIRKLPYRILWKCELEITSKPQNLFISKWFPQSDILAHLNLVAFVTHSGLLSTTEAIYHGVPMIALPVFGDQPMNAAKAVNKGIAEKLDFLTLTEDKLYETIKKVINDPEYKTRIQKISKMFKDQPLKPLDRAVHTVEYVIKHKPGKYLRSSAVELWWFQLYSLDIILFVFCCFFLIYMLIVLFIRKLFSSKKVLKTKIQ